MAEQGPVGVVFVRRWWWSLAVYEVQWVAREWVTGMEDTAGPLAWFASLDAIHVISPGSISVERFWFCNVESCDIHVFGYRTVSNRVCRNGQRLLIWFSKKKKKYCRGIYRLV